MTILKNKMIAALRPLLFEAFVSILLIAMSPICGDAFDISLDDDCREPSELNETIAKKKKDQLGESSTIRNEKTEQSVNVTHEAACFLIVERTPSGEASRGPERAMMLTVPVTANNYRMALEKYLSLVNTLLPEQCLPFLSQPHPQPLLERSPPAEDISPAGFAASSPEQNRLFDLHHPPDAVKIAEMNSHIS